jgi:hypothetical protein
MFSITFGTPWYITFITALSGVLVGGFITFVLTHAKTRSEMSWELKREAYNAILKDVDQAVTNQGNKINEAKTNRRRARHLIRLAFGQADDITTTANTILDKLEGKDGGLNIQELNKIIDDELMPKVEADLKETIEDWWKFWKR